MREKVVFPDPLPPATPMIKTEDVCGRKDAMKKS
jgi:hypothetical protein